MTAKAGNRQDEQVEALQAMLHAALNAYEHAKVNRVLDTAEQERAGELVAAVDTLEAAAADLLHKAGLAHIAGAPLVLGARPAAARADDDSVTGSFVAAHKAFVDLRAALLGLAQKRVEQGQWAEACQVVRPLLADPQAPLFEAAQTLLLGLAYSRLVLAQWQDVRTVVEPLLSGPRVETRDAAQTLLRDSYAGPVNEALQRGDLESAWKHLEAADSKFPKDDALDGPRRAVYEAQIALARQSLAQGKWSDTQQLLQPLLAEKKGPLADAAQTLLRDSYLGPINEALQCGDPETALGHLNTASSKYPKDGELDRLRHPIVQAQLGINWIVIPDGEFLYGENKHRLHLPAFRISRTPITNAQYERFVLATKAEAPSHWANGRLASSLRDHPVVNVSWNDAQAFCQWAGVELPSEKQWEKAARGTDGRTYPWGEAAPDGTRCNFNNEVKGTTMVGSYSAGASPYGLMDMAGNVWEWCQDPHESGGYVVRGGAFYGNADYVRCVARNWYFDLYRFANYGFRVVAPGL